MDTFKHLIFSLLFFSAIITNGWSQNGAIDVFADEEAKNWTFDSPYSHGEGYVDHGILKVYADKNAGDEWTSFYFNPGTMDLSQHPFLSVKLRSEKGMEFRIDLKDVNGNVTDASPIVKSVPGNNNFNTYYFDYRDKLGSVDAANINSIRLIMAPGSTFEGTIDMDSLLIGDYADVPSIATPDTIQLNQIGFYPDQPKKAVVTGSEADSFYVSPTNSQDIVYRDTLTQSKVWDYSGDSARIADFTRYKQTGEYQIQVADIGTSHPFQIADNVHNSLSKGAIKAFYFQRASTAIKSPWGEKWTRAAGQPDNNVKIHSSAASTGRSTGSSISAPKGWYDAGDYNKYVVNSGITTYTMMSLYEHFSPHYDTLTLSIPENTNNLPDILDEVLWNLRWMLKMQDPHDGGVYHKLTHSNFVGGVMPGDVSEDRYVVEKSTAATLNFAAVMAQAYRIFNNFEQELPGLADSCLYAAKRAYKWSMKHPDVIYDQDEMNQQFDPDISTGEYGDNGLSDEFNWAAAEMYISTQTDSFYNHLNLSGDITSPPSWPDVNQLAFMSLNHYRTKLTSIADTSTIKDKVLNYGNALVNTANNSPYNIAMGNQEWNFIWGSNSVAANQGMMLLQAFRATGDSSYYHTAIANLDYILGRNATNYSFVTGYGDNTPKDIHHRISHNDGIEEPVPGLLVGGPHNSQSDGCNYPSDKPAKSYIDDYCSYSTNEIAINWNAPLAYLSGAIEAHQAGVSKSVLSFTPKDTAAPEVPDQYRTTGIFNNKTQETSIKIYPNPVKEHLTIESANATLQSARIINSMGQRFKNINLKNRYSPYRISLDDLPKGVYIIHLRNQKGVQTQTFYKQ